MTCIAAISDGNQVWMGGDSAGVSGWSLSVRSDPKVFEISNYDDRYLIGFTSSYRMGQLIQYSFSPPKCTEDDLMAFMVRTFVPALQRCLGKGGYQAKKDDVKSGGQFLVGFRGQLFNIEPDYQVGIPMARFDSVGCGRDVALGSLTTTNRYHLSLSERILTALEAAEEFSAGVRGPFTIRTL